VRPWRQREGLDSHRGYLLMGAPGHDRLEQDSPEGSAAIVAVTFASMVYNYSGGFSLELSSGPTTRCSTTLRARSGMGAGATSPAPMTRTPARTTSAPISTARASRR
jgi:hypothetical protein